MKGVVIDSMELYDYVVSRGYEPLIDERFPMDIALRKEVQKQKFGGNNMEGNQKFYSFCLKHLPLVCHECKRPIRNPSAINVSHILTRGSNPDKAHDPRNVYILCAECHEAYEHKPTRRRMRIFDESEERIKKLKEEYRNDVK